MRRRKFVLVALGVLALWLAAAGAQAAVPRGGASGGPAIASGEPDIGQGKIPASGEPDGGQGGKLPDSGEPDVGQTGRLPASGEPDAGSGGRIPGADPGALGATRLAHWIGALLVRNP